MGYLNTQLEKKAYTLPEILTMATLGGAGSAAVGALKGEKEDRLASILGGVIGGGASVPVSNILDTALNKSKRLTRLINKYPKLEPLVSLGSVAAPLIALSGAGSYAGSALAKLFKNNPSD